MIGVYDSIKTQQRPDSPQDVSPRDLAAILDFMYHGEVNVKQDHLNSFLAVAERLRVRGLCQNDKQGGTNNSEPVNSAANSTKFINSERSKVRETSSSGFTEPSAKKQRISIPLSPLSKTTMRSMGYPLPL